MGNAIALGRLGTGYLRACRKQYGPAFSLELVGQRMCFLFEPHLIEMFFKAPESQITFRPAVEQFTQRVFGLPSKDFFPKHSQILLDLRHMLTPSTLQSHAQQLAHHAEQHMEELFPVANDQVELFSAVRKLVFRSAVPVLFGSKFAAGSHPGFIDELEEVFVAFESGFEMAASPIPHLFQPQFTRSRGQLLSWFTDAHARGLFKGTPVGELLEKAGLRDELAPHLLLALLWASQANTVPATFWAVAMICLPEHKEHLQAIRDELWEGVSSAEKSTANSETEGEGGYGNDVCSTSFSRLLPPAYKLATDRRSCIARCTSEATRLRVQSLDVRFAANNLQLDLSNGNKLDIPKGCILALCPYEIHHDDALFPPSSSSFNPARAPMSLGDGNAIMPTVAGIAFGGGAYRCPGRFFAEMEVALLVQLILAHRDVTFTAKTTDSQSAASKDGFWDTARLFAVDLLGKERAFWGLGLCGGSGRSTTHNTGHTSSSANNGNEYTNMTRVRHGDEPEGCGHGNGKLAGSKGSSAHSNAKALSSSLKAEHACSSKHPSEPDAQGDSASGNEGRGASTDCHFICERALETSSGDPGGRLPLPDHRRLVGMKVPAGPCMVTLTRIEEEYLVV